MRIQPIGDVEVCVVEHVEELGAEPHVPHALKRELLCQGQICFISSRPGKTFQQALICLVQICP